MKHCTKCDNETDLELNCNAYCGNCMLERTKKHFLKTLSRALDTKGRYGKSTKSFRIMIAYNGSLSSKCCVSLMKDYIQNRPQVEKVMLCYISDNEKELQSNDSFPLLQKSWMLDPNSCLKPHLYVEQFDDKKNDLLYNTAIEQNCDVLLFCHDTEHMSSYLMTRIVLGKAQGIENFKVFDTITINKKPLKIIYPLQECQQQELINYATICRIPYKLTTSYPTDDFASVTKGFLFQQQLEKSATCDIINSTLAKVKTNNK